MLTIHNSSHLRDVVAVTNDPIKLLLWDGRTISAKNHTFKKDDSRTRVSRPDILSQGFFLENDEKLEDLIDKLLDADRPFTTRIHPNGVVCTLRWTITKPVAAKPAIAELA